LQVARSSELSKSIEPKPELIRSPVAVIQRVLNHEFATIPQALSTPNDRINHLFDAVLSRHRDLASHGRTILGLAINALDDMQYLGAGAVAFAAGTRPEDSNSEHIDLVKRSIPKLVFPAKLSDGQWQDVRSRLSNPQTRPGERAHLDPDYLYLLQDPVTQIPYISFSSGALTDMDSRIDVSGGRGCPAQGIIIERSFGLFIDSVYGNTEHSLA